MVTGIIKFPGFLQFLRVNPDYPVQGILTQLHDWLGLAVVGLSLLHVILHWNWLVEMTKRIWGSQRVILAYLLVLFILPLAVIRSKFEFARSSSDGIGLNEIAVENQPTINQETAPDPSNTVPRGINSILIEGIGEFNFDATQISATRDDVFMPGFFGIFDILVHLDEIGEIDMNYSYSSSLDTYLVQSINGIPNWWYVTYYDGGWPERNVWRMDLYPYKDLSVIRISNVSERFLELLYSTFEDEVIRRDQNKDKVIIPEVIIRTRDAQKLVFNDLEIKPYNLREDFLIQGTITALDAILTLGELGEISYELNWYESIGSAGLVKNYFVDAINEDRSYDRCGFVYETGSKDFYGFDGNHIHIASDLRVLTSPEYIEFFWICI
jgi:hypothetical protein